MQIGAATVQKEERQDGVGDKRHKLCACVCLVTKSCLTLL